MSISPIQAVEYLTTKRNARILAEENAKLLLMCKILKEVAVDLGHLPSPVAVVIEKIL